MFRKYEKTFRIKVPNVSVPGKFMLNDKEAKALFGAAVIVEEKMDGANVGIVRHKQGFHLQKRGSLVSSSEHAQFQYFHNWANVQNWDKIMALPVGITLYGELMFAKHTVFYDKLPDYFLAFDAFDRNEEVWYSLEQRQELCERLGFCQVPLLKHGFVTKESLFGEIPKISTYGSEAAEGVVVKRYLKDGRKLQGKLVRPEFIKHLEENDHWMHNAVTRNVLRTFT